MITFERLKELATYDPETGQWSGNLSTYSSHPRYNVVRVDGHQYRSGRLAFLYMTGNWPIEIDHINRDTRDDRWENLREATRSENLANRGKFGKSGLPKGVHKYGNRYRAACGYKGKEIYLGMFATVEEASEAYQVKAKELHGAFTPASLPS